jgi:hypothetical protein
VNDDWRLQVEPKDPGHAGHLLELLQAHDLEHDLSSSFGDRVAVSHEGSVVFLYAGDRDQIERARELVRSLAERHGWELEIELRRWHKTAEQWEDPDLPLPEGAAAERAEHEELIATERRETAEHGHPEFEVRINLPSRHEARALAKQLDAEGIPTVHRWRYVLVGATDEDAAKELAERIRAEAPADAEVKVEGTWQIVWAERPPNPFAFLGGLAGD